MGYCMQDNADKVKRQRRITRARVSLSLLGACVVLLFSGCTRSHEQETVTVAPRTPATRAPAATAVNNSNSLPPTVDAETEAAGDAIAHAIVALKTRRRDEALYYMNLARSRLTRRLNHSAVATNANSDSTRERLINELRELETAERSLRHNAFDQSRARLVTISDELDQLH